MFGYPGNYQKRVGDTQAEILNEPGKSMITSYVKNIAKRVFCQGYLSGGPTSIRGARLFGWGEKLLQCNHLKSGHKKRIGNAGTL